MFSYVSLEERIPRDHPLRSMRTMVDDALRKLSRRFSSLYADAGRPSIPPERLLRALLLQILYSIRSERLLMEQLEYNLLFRWFVGLGIDDPVWVATVFTKNRDRLLQGEVAQEFFAAVLAQGGEHGLLSSEHFSVDGTLIEAWASQKSFRRKDHPDDDSNDDTGNPTVNFRGERRSNATHESTTDPDARLARKKGQTSHLAYMGHLLTENRNGLIVSAMLTQADGYAERVAALTMVEGVPGKRRSRWEDHGFDAEEFVAGCRTRHVTPPSRRARRTGPVDRAAPFVTRAARSVNASASGSKCFAG
jgi:transposase